MWCDLFGGTGWHMQIICFEAMKVQFITDEVGRKQINQIFIKEYVIKFGLLRRFMSCNPKILKESGVICSIFEP